MPQNKPNSFETDATDDRDLRKDVAMTESIWIFIVIETQL